MSPDCLEPQQLFMHLSLYKNPCCIIILVDKVAVQLPNFALVFVACRVPAHCEPRTVHNLTWVVQTTEDNGSARHIRLGFLSSILDL